MLQAVSLMEPRAMPLSGFEQSQFHDGATTFPVYRTGTGPGVVIIHEIPGITPQVARFARRVADAGFTVVLPELFGTAGRRLSVGYLADSVARVCVRREFHVLARNGTSPIVEPLKALCRLAEPIKFADATADPGRMPADLAFVRELVHRTTPVEAKV